MGLISLILCPITIPVRIFRALMTLLSLLWSAIFIAILIYAGLNWKKVENFFKNIASKIDSVKDLIDNAKDQIDVLTNKVDDIAGSL